MKQFLFEEPEFDWDRAWESSARLPASEQDLLLRCATIRTFDRPLYDQVLGKGLGPEVIGFDALASHHSVEALPGTEDRFQVRRSQREEMLNTWLPAARGIRGAETRELPETLRQFGSDLLQFYAEQGQDLDRLYHMVVLGLPGAGDLLDKLFADAESRFDLSRCHAILQILEDQQRRLGPDLMESLRQKRTRLEARSMWAKEYYQTVLHLEREELRGLVDRLIEGQEFWILHIYGPGGVGKTEFIREVIARRCVPAGIPVASIDFDFVEHIARVAREPWRLLLRIAAQLDRQLPGFPLGDLLKDNPEYIAQAGKRPAFRRRDFQPLSDEEREQRWRDVVRRFIAIMDDELDGRPFLLIFDTLENLRHRPVDMKAAFNLLAEVRAGCSGLRVILAGRFDLSEAVDLPPGDEARLPESLRMTGFVERFADHEYTHRLKPFSPEEARDYLVEKRGLDPGDDRLEAIIEMSMIDDQGCTPFYLTFFADHFVEEDIDAEEIRQNPRAYLAYLIRRVVNRILDRQVRWLLRYGVVPRGLTKDFVKEVIAPYLPKAMAGQSEYDDPHQDVLEPSDLVLSDLEHQPFELEDRDRAPLDIDALWRKLYSYASSESWVYAAPDLPDALTLHPNIAAPMRYLLREQERKGRPIFQLLNRDAAKYYEKRAKAEPGWRGIWLAEAVFHKYQTGDDDADAYWHEQMDAVQGEGDAEAILELAQDVLKLADKSVLRAWLPGEEPLDIGVGVQARAYYELARYHLDRDAEAVKVTYLLEQAERLNPARDPVVPPARLAYIRARLEFADGKREKALQTCWQALKAPAGPDDELDLLLLYAEVLRSLDRPWALDQFYLAYSQALKLDEQRAREIAPRLAVDLEDQERFRQANELYERLWQEAYEASDLRAMGKSLLSMMRVYVAMGQEGAAAERGTRGLDALYGSDSRAALYWWRRCRAEIELASGMPDQAQAELQQLVEWLRLSSLPEDADDWDLVETDLQARIATARLDIGLAVAKLQALAGDFYGPASNRGARCYLECARLYLDELEDLKQSGQYLERALDGARDTATAVEHRLLDIKRLALAGERAEARQAAERLMAEEQKLPAGLAARVAVEAVIQTGGAEEAWDRLVIALEKLYTPTECLLALAELRRCPTLEKTEKASQVLYLLPGSPDEQGQDPRYAAVRLADVYRVLGEAGEARDLVLWGQEACREPLRLGLLRQAYLAHDRLGWEPGELEAVELVPRDHPSWGRNKELCGLFVLEHAERLLEFLDDADRAVELRDEAWELLGPSSPWEPRVATLSTRIALARGDSDVAQELLAEAEKLFEQIGSASYSTGLRQSVQEAVEAAPAPPPPPALAPEPVTAHPRIKIGVGLPSTEMWQVSYDDGTTEHWLDVRELPPRLERLLGTALSGGYGGSYFFKEFKHDWYAIGREVGAVLFSPQILDRFPPGPLDFAWLLGGGELDWVPWEFVSVEPDPLPLALSGRCRFLYRHVAGPLPVPAQEPSALDVLIVRQGEEMELYEQRGYTQSTGFDLASAYHFAGARVREIDQPDAEELADVLGSARPRILHLVANVREERGQRLYLDFGGYYAKRMPARFTPSELGHAVLRARGEPLVILDIPAPPSTSERLRQLCLRNTYAAELAAFSRISAILGTGLGEGWAQMNLTERLVQAVGSGAPVGLVAKAIWDAWGDPAKPVHEAFSDNPIEAILPFLGTALFARDPKQAFGWKGA